MDCIDCHNRATHIYKDAETVVDEQIRLGFLDQQLPYIKRQASAALQASYPTQEATQKGIADEFFNFYKRYYPDTVLKQSGALAQAVNRLQQASAAYIHPQMKITWGSYPSHIGHQRDLGCFRCHNADMTDERGESIRHDCTMCHSILAMDSPTRFEYLTEPEEDVRAAQMNLYLRDEFLKTKY